jgi:hypothetical protein
VTGELVREGENAQINASKRIALCWDSTSDFEPYPGFADRSRAGAYVLSIFYDKDNDYWATPPGCLFIPYDGELQKVTDVEGTFGAQAQAIRETKRLAKRPKAFVGDCAVILPELFMGLVDRSGMEQVRNSVALDTIDEAHMLIQLCAVLNASNVRTAEAAPPAALNKKRLKGGKTPFFSYHVLQLDTDQGGARGTAIGGTHESPRLHLRRGHLRRIEGKVKPVYVRSHLVGDPRRGFADKDYSVRTSQIPK